MASTERFEMRIDETVLAKVDRWRAEQEDLPSRSEAIRRLIERGLPVEDQEHRRSVEFSDGEKLLIVMMRDLYRHLKLQRGEINPDFIAEVIFGGHYWAPMWEMEGVFHNHADSPKDVRFVVDVLDMWSFIEQAYSKLSKKDKERLAKEAEPFGENPKFYGFDGNNEPEHLGIARFLIEEMGRFSSFKDRELNSHMPTLGTYGRMLNVFLPLRKTLVGVPLDVEQLVAILKAKRYPED